ncbi:MAG TPA: M28 family peptidase [Casimicrobiaceae bacterium]|nr:M28 family peptidase [Casimicrobiaceae bacterium]
MSLAGLLAGIDRERLRRDVEHIADHIPYRLAGSANGDAMARYSAARLAEVGAAGRVEQIPGLVSFPQAGELLVIDAPEMRVAAQTCGHSASTSSGGLRARLVDAAGGSAADYQRSDARGKIALVDLALAPTRPEKARLAAAAGAAGLVTINWGPADGRELPYGSVKPVWGNPDAASGEDAGTLPMPCIGISRADGLALQARVARGATEVQLHASSDNAWRTVSYTLGEIAGHGDDFIIAGGHQDSWIGPAATDNATGSACLIELARLFAARRGELRRGLVFGLWEGHETGTMLSSAHYVDRHWEQLRDHAVAYLQIDQPACAGAKVWNSHSNTEVRRFQQEVDAAVLGERTRRWRRSTKIGDSSFFGLGVPMLASLAAFDDATLRANGNAAFGWWHHTVRNTLDKVDFDDLVVHVKVFATYLWTLCTVPVLPFEFASVASGIAARLRELGASGDFDLEPLEQRAAELARLTARLDDAGHRCNTAFEHGEGDEARAQALNAVLKRLSRLLISVEATVAGVYGHDPYGLSAQSTLLPALHDIASVSAMPQGAQRWRLETSLWRARNRIADALDNACSLVEQAVART